MIGSTIGIDHIVESWGSALESKDFGLSRAKMEYMECGFSKIRNREGGVKLRIMKFLKVIIFGI